jgi:hypothetical protein
MKFRQRKVIEIDWSDDLDKIKGLHASILAANPNWEEPVEVRNVENDGRAVVTFASTHSGECEITVKGSKGGEVTETATIS